MSRVSRRAATIAGSLMVAAMPLASAWSSSHMDAPLITLDDPANTTDVYAFVSRTGGVDHLTTALAVQPFEEPGIGPNTYRFDDTVRYKIHVALDDDVAAGQSTLTYRFDFTTEFPVGDTTLQVYLGEVTAVGGPNQNLRQTYRVTRFDHRTRERRLIGEGIVPPNNQGLVTPFYNQDDDGESPARAGVERSGDLDPYTAQAIAELGSGHRVFAGQRDDGFYADIQSIFDLDFGFGGPNKPFDSQGGFNVHTIVLDIPLDELDGAEVAGVYATAERRQQTTLSTAPLSQDDAAEGPFVQVARQGNPLFNEALVAVEDKDLYNRTPPTRDATLFDQYAREPELAAVLGLPATDRDDLVAIFIPDLIKVDLTTGPARLAGERGFHRLGIFGGDVLTNDDGADVPGGWPNGRRFGDDVVDIAIIALGLPPSADVDVDGVTGNDITYHQVFPYAATPLNGRSHGHHGN